MYPGSIGDGTDMTKHPAYGSIRLAYGIRRRAFTLFEVAISLAIVTVVILSMALWLPSGLRAQQLARSRIFAAVKVVELIDQAVNGDHGFTHTRVERPSPLRDAAINRCAHACDVEQRVANPWTGALPVPLAIARRLDADGDEIQRVLDQGGYLFYADPKAQGRSVVAVDDQALSNEAQRLVFAFDGYPQQNALNAHPCMAWPYYEFWPSPPFRWEDDWRLMGFPAADEMDAVRASAWPGTGDYAGLLRYRDNALALVAALGIPATTVGGRPAPDLPAPLPMPPWSVTDPAVHPEPWHLLAMKALANAATRLTDPTMLAANGITGAAAIDLADHAKACHEAALRWNMRYAGTSPYDWGCTRALNRQIAWDNPLLQYDLFAGVTPLDDGDVGWRVIAGLPAGERPRTYGARSHSGVDSAAGAWWGDNTGFTLCAPFAAAERCRQVVFWAVDWKSYVDFETAPSAPIDAARGYHDTAGDYVHGWHNPRYGNPEAYLLFNPDPAAPRDASGAAAELYRFTWNFYPGSHPRPANPFGGGYGDACQQATPLHRRLLLGLDGADRNGDGQLSHGVLPTATRLRAVTVARFNLYDPRLGLGLGLRY